MGHGGAVPGGASGHGARPHADQRRPGPARRAHRRGAAGRLHLPRLPVQPAGAAMAPGAGLRHGVVRRAAHRRHPHRLHLIHNIENDFARAECLRERQADVGGAPAAEREGRGDGFSGEELGQGCAAVWGVDGVEGGGAGVVGLDEAVGARC